MVSASGSGRGREQVEVPQVIRDVTTSWDNYCTLKADYESMSDERTRLFARANEPGCPLVEKADIQQNQIPALEAEINRNMERRGEIASGIRESIDAAVTAARGLRGSARADALASLDSVKEGLGQIEQEEADLRAAAESLSRIAAETTTTQAVPQRTAQPAATQAPVQEMVQVGGEWVTRAEYERIMQQVQGALNLGTIMQTGGPSMGLAGTPQLTPEYSTTYSTVIGWNRRVTELESENASIIQKIQNYRSKLGDAESEGNTRRESYYNGKIEELEREFDANVAEQSQLMANLTRSLSDALYDAMGNRRHSDALMRIYDDWAQRQAKLLDLIDIRGQGPAETAATYETAKFICTQTIEAVYSQMLGVPNSYIVFPPNRPSAEIVQAAQRGAVPTFPPTQTAVVPTTAPQALQVPAGAFQYSNPQTGRTYRITLDGVDLTGRTIEEVYALAQEYSSSAAKFRKLHVQRIDARGRVDYTYASREHVRDNFFQQQLGWAPYATEAERVASRRAVAETDRRMQGYFAEGEAPAAAPAAVAAPVAAPRTAEMFLAGNGSLYGVDRAGANQLAGFMNGTRTVLNFDIRGEEQANRVYEIVSAEVERRRAEAESEGRRLQLTFDRPVTPGGKYHITLQLLGMLETAQQVAVETGNPFAGMLGAEPRVGFPMGVFEESSARFARNNPGMGITVTGYGSPTDVANDPESQAVAYVYDSFRRFQVARFVDDNGNRENGWERMVRLIYTEGDGAQAVATINGQPILSLEENAAFTAAHYTLEAGRVMRTPTPQGGTEENLEGVRVNVFDGNIRAALEGDSNPQDPTYAALAYSRLQAYYTQPNLVELNMAKLLPETQASINAAAEYMGMMIYRARTSVTGEPATAEERDTLLTACVNASRIQLLVKMESEVGMEAAYGTFTWDGKDYQVGTSTLVRRDVFPFPRGTELSGARTATVLFVPSENPGELIIVGYMGTRQEQVGTTGAMVSVPEARLLEPGQEIRYYAGASNPNYRLSPFDSLGLFGLTERWSQNLPLIDLMAQGIELDIRTPLFKEVEPPALRPGLVPPAEGYITGNFDLRAADYGAGADIDDARFIMENVRLGDSLLTSAEVFAQKNVWLEFNNFRKVGENRYYATAAPEVTSLYVDRFENPQEIQNVAEFAADGRVYVYVRAGKIVDAERQVREEGVQRLYVGTYQFTLGEDGDTIDAAQSTIRVLPDYYPLIFARMGQPELEAKLSEDKATMSDYRLEIYLNTQASALRGERVLPYVNLSTGPIPAEESLAGAATEVSLDIYDHDSYMVPRWERIREIDTRFGEIREMYGRYITFEEWDAVKLEMDALHLERDGLCNEMLQHTANALAEADRRGIPLAPEARAALENQMSNLNLNLEYSRTEWARWGAARDDFDLRLAQYR